MTTDDEAPDVCPLCGADMATCVDGPHWDNRETRATMQCVECLASWYAVYDFRENQDVSRG
jgi:hypothetical protein